MPFDALALHWEVLSEEARVHGKTVDRSNWRLVGPMHCAETKEQAIADVQYGIEHWFRYFQAVAAFPQMAVLGDSAAEMIDFINKSGLGVVGTPEECAAQIDRLVKQSNGGFGCYLLLGHNWANPLATAKSFALIARQARMRLGLVGGVERRAYKCQDCARQDEKDRQGRAIASSRK